MPIISLSDAKTLLQIASSDTSKDALITLLIPIIQNKVLNYCGKTFDIYPTSSYDTSFTFAASGSTITDSNSNFLNNGFVVGQDIRVKNTANNDGIYSVKTVTASVLTVNEALLDEPAPVVSNIYSTNYVLIQAIKFPAGLELPTAQYLEWLLYNKYHLVTSERIGEYSATYKKEADILTLFDQYKSLKFT